MKIKTTMRNYFRLTRVTVILKMEESKCWQGCEEIRTLVLLRWEWQKVQLLLKNDLGTYSKKLNIDFPLRSSNCIPRYIPPTELEAGAQNRNLYMNVHGSALHDSQTVETTHQVVNRYCASINGILFSPKKK